MNQTSLHPQLKFLLPSNVVEEAGGIGVRVASSLDRSSIMAVITSVAGERKYLQTDRYVPTLYWEQLLHEGVNVEKGLLLFAVEDGDKIIGFARLYPDDEHSCAHRAGNVGLALLPSYRSRGIGAIILKILISCAIELHYEVLSANILESNLRSIRLFTKYGFKLLGCRDIFLDFLNDHVPEFHYEVTLSRCWEA